MTTMTDEDRKAAELAALDDLDDDGRLTYHKVRAGLDKLEARLPSECNDDTKATIGEIIKKCGAADKFAQDTYAELVEPWREKVKRQGILWKGIADRARALKELAQGLVDKLLQEAAKRKEEEERAARERVAKAQREQAEAEAKALAAQTAEEQAAAQKQADFAWSETKKAVDELNKGPAQTSVKVGDVTVFEKKNIDFEILDMGAFATAHPELVEVRRGDTLKGLREAINGLAEMPETLPGWPGLKLKLKKGSSSR